MCSEYVLKTNPKDVETALGIPVINMTGDKGEWNATIKFGGKAPVIGLGEEGAEFLTRILPVSPFPSSRLSGFENQSDGKDTESDGAEGPQIKRIYDRPRWKKTFNDAPLLIPMTSFTEFAYWGKMKGSALAFSIPGENLFFAAGISIKPFVPKTGKENGFSILTHTATHQMLEYHQRLIVLLPQKAASGYLDEMSARERFDYLIEHRYTGELAVKKTREMAKGWKNASPPKSPSLNANRPTVKY